MALPRRVPAAFSRLPQIAMTHHRRPRPSSRNSQPQPARGTAHLTGQPVLDQPPGRGREGPHRQVERLGARVEPSPADRDHADPAGGAGVLHPLGQPVQRRSRRPRPGQHRVEVGAQRTAVGQRASAAAVRRRRRRAAAAGATSPSAPAPRSPTRRQVVVRRRYSPCPSSPHPPGCCTARAPGGRRPPAGAAARRHAGRRGTHRVAAQPVGASASARRDLVVAGGREVDVGLADGDEAERRGEADDLVDLAGQPRAGVARADRDRDHDRRPAGCAARRRPLPASWSRWPARRRPRRRCGPATSAAGRSPR